MGTPIKRAGSWRIQVKVGEVRDSRTFPTKAEAAAWGKARAAELRTRPGRPDHTLGQAFEKYSTEVSPTKRGKRWEQLRLRALQRHRFAQKAVQALTQTDIAAWRDERLKAVAGPTVKREMNLIRSVLGIARKEWRWLDGNPMEDVARPPDSRSRRRRVSDDEADRVCLALGYVSGSTPVRPGHYVALAFLFALETAMRAGEITALRRRDLFLRDCYVKIRKSKNGDERDVPLTPRAIALLKLLPLSDDAVFAVDPRSRDTLFRKARSRARIDDLHFHDSRAEAIWRLSKKLDVLQLATMIGHRDIKSLMFYYNESATELAKRLA
jgi:integrase